MPYLENPAPVSFMEHRPQWQDGTLSVSEILAIARTPEVVGRVPNPETFAQTEAVTEYIGMSRRPDGATRPTPTARQILCGEPFDTSRVHFGQYAEAWETGFRPTLDIIAEQSRGLGIDLAKAAVHICVKVDTGARQYRQSGGTHPDLPDTTRRRPFIAFGAANIAPTGFFAQSFSLPQDAKYRDLADGVDAYGIRSQADPNCIWQAAPFEIISFDDTLPHTTPPVLKYSDAMRTFFRVWICPDTPNYVLA